MVGARSEEPADDGRVVRRKVVVPDLAASVVPRERVTTLIGSLLDRSRVVRVSATAGSGKTSAVVSALAERGHPVAWLTIDHTDSAPGRLVTYLQASLARVQEHVDGVATSAMARGIAHAEAAALLADGLDERPLTLVLDELERLHGPAPWSVLDAFVRYAPTQLRIVLISRHEIPLALSGPQGGLGAPVIGDVELALTTDEARRVLEREGNEDIDANEAVASTGGWMIGVLFESWRSLEHVTGTGGEADPLHGYLASHILGALTPEDREFLVRSSVLDVVSLEAAEQLGLADAGTRLASLQTTKIPVTWDAERRTMRCHSRFREYLLELLRRRGGAEMRELRTRHGRLLLAAGHDEEAVEEFLRAGAVDEALEPAARAVVRVIDRLDFTVAERWIDALDAPAELAIAELMLAIARDDIGRGVRAADRLSALGIREQVARDSPRAAVLMAWVYLHEMRAADVRAIGAAVPPGPVADAVRYALSVVEDDPDAAPFLPESSVGDPTDGLVFVTRYALGRFRELLAHPATDTTWLGTVTGPWAIASLRAMGRLETALEYYRAAQDARYAPMLDAWVGPELLIDAGLREDAMRALDRGHEFATASGSLFLRTLNRIAAVRLALRIDRDTETAAALLEPLQAPGGRRTALSSELIDLWDGCRRLLDGDDEGALRALRRAVEGMERGGRYMEAQTAAIYLAEAEWRAGEEQRADAAADLALRIARAQHSNHGLLCALQDFPAVASRRIDAAPPDSEWHGIGRVLIRRGGQLDAVPTRSAVVREFGRLAVVDDDSSIELKLAKSMELVSYVAASGSATREELLGALFDGRADDAARSYLRKAIHHAKKTLPGILDVDPADGAVEIARSARVTTDSERFASLVRQAPRLRGADRAAVLTEALELYDRGPFLPDCVSRWAGDRRQELATHACAARLDLADVLMETGDLQGAQAYVERVLEDEPFRESAWRSRMQLANLLGDGDGVIAAFRSCERALAEFDARPAASTRQLLESLRR